MPTPSNLRVSLTGIRRGLVVQRESRILILQLLVVVALVAFKAPNHHQEIMSLTETNCPRVLPKERGMQ